MTAENKEYEHNCPMCQHKFKDSIPDEASLLCGNERPPRDVLCQLEKTHAGRHRAVIFWED